MKLYGSPASPFVQRPLIAARLKGHDLPVEPPLGGSMRSPEFAPISPLRRIPVLDHDGWTLAESGAIVAYLDEVLEGPPLLPADPRERAQARLIADLALELAVGLRPVMLCEVFRMIDEPVLAGAGRRQAAEGLAAIGRAMRPGDAFAAGAAPGIADAVLFPLLTLMEQIDGACGTMALVEAEPVLATYKARAAAHPVLARTAAEMREGFAAIMARNAQPAAD